MSTRVLTLVAGGAASLFAASALAQSTTDPSSRRTAVQPSATTIGLADAESVMRDLVGAWKVDVTIHDPTWMSHKKGISPSRSGTDARDSDRTDPTRDANRNDPNRADPNRPSGSTSTLLSTSMSGVARSSMFGSILRSNTVLASGGLDSRSLPDADAPAPSRDRSGAAGTGGDMFRGLSFISFDENAQRYSAVFMDDRSGEIQFRTGNYDSGSKRIVFDGGSGMGGSMSPAWDSRNQPDRDPSRTTPGTTNPRPGETPSTTPGLTPPATDPINQPSPNQTPSTGAGMGWRSHEGHRVVLELLDRNNYRVTMYDSSGSGMTGRSTTGTTTPASPSGTTTTPPGGTPSTTTNPPSTTPSTTPGTPGAIQPTSGEFGRIIYQANYSRLNSADEAKYRDWIKGGDDAGKADRNP